MEPTYAKIKEMLDEIGTIGYRPGQGITRLAFSPAFAQTVEALVAWAGNAGLNARIDAVGNLCVWLDGEETRSIVIGSHLDTVPNGGMLDGALGVFAGLECLRTLKENGIRPRHRLEVIGFTEEEGNVIGGTFGSRCVAGLEQEESVLQQLANVGLGEEDVRVAARSRQEFMCYLELHIEQGALLETEGKSIGVVEGIVGIRRYMTRLRGVANHAGATPMRFRDDALVKAARLIAAFDDIVRKQGEALVGTIGHIANYPNAVNVIPSCVEMCIELRSLDSTRMDLAMEELRTFAQGMDVEFEQILDEKETLMDARICERIEEACRRNGISYMRMSSGAGHDAISMARITPCGMIFIPSIGGISHREDESSDWMDIEAGSRVLLETILSLDAKGLE